MANTRVITQRGGTPEKAINYVKSKPYKVQGYKVIVLHVGTNWMSKKEEWALYLKKVNGFLSEREYQKELEILNPPPAIGDANRFRKIYQELIDLIKALNQDVIILVSSILPRLWDHDRRHHIRATYNRMLKHFNGQPNVFYIPSDRPFFNKSGELRPELFDYDGLHLSNKGAVILRTFICEKIDKARRNLLK